MDKPTRVYTSLKEVIAGNREHIVRETLRRFEEVPWTPYKDFMLESNLIAERASIFFGLLLEAMDGNPEKLVLDQEQAGYDRALRGFNLANVLSSQRVVRTVIFDLLKQLEQEEKLQFTHLYEDIQKFQELMIAVYQTNALSFIRTREELINEKISQLELLHDFTRKLVASADVETVTGHFMDKVAVLFEIEEAALVLYRDGDIKGIYGRPKEVDEHLILPLAEKVIEEDAPYYMNEMHNFSRSILDWEHKRRVILPLSAHGRTHGAVALYNPGGRFLFGMRELGILDQFLKILIVALDNAFMIEEIERNRHELQLVTVKMIEVREEERKHLAAEIHDTFAQSLVGLNYKLRFCEELLEKDSDQLREGFDDLRVIVERAVRQSRTLISSLRPDLIDTVGLVPALKRLAKDFAQETGIRVNTHFPEDTQLSPKVNICIFRVINEALNNVFKHAEADATDCYLHKSEDEILLSVSDNGKGFDLSQGYPWVVNNDNLGLLFMKERVEGIGGRLAIYSALGEGCLIEARIPSYVEGN